MQAFLSKFTYKGFSLLPFVLLIPLVLLAVSIHWAYDESLTYMGILGNTPLEIFQYARFKLANHHMLNSLYFHYLQQADIKSLFVYRLPALLCFFPYYYFIRRLLSGQEGYRLNHLDQLALFFWPYYIYFANARGYGPAMVGFVGALLMFKQYLKEGKPVHLLWFTLLGIFSCVNIFSFLFPVVAMVIILGARRFREIITSPQRILILLLFLPVVYYIFDKGQVVSKNDVAIIGRDSLFKGGTLSSLVSFLSLMDFAPVWVFKALKLMVSLTLLPVLFIFVKRARVYVELTIVAVTLLLLVVAHYATGAMYPVYRGVAYLILLFMLSFAYSNFRRNIFYSLHFTAIIVCGLTYMTILFWFHSQKSMNDVLADVAKKPSLVLIEDVHPSTRAVNHMYHNDSLQLFNCPTLEVDSFDNALDTVNYIVCIPDRLKKTGKDIYFERQYGVATFFYFNKAFYIRKGWK